MIKAAYEKYLLPKLLDTCCSTKPVNYQRKKIVPDARGTILEIGIGSGPVSYTHLRAHETQ